MKKSLRSFVILGTIVAAILLCFVGLSTRKPGIQAETPIPVKGLMVCAAILGVAALSSLVGDSKSISSCARRTGEPLMRISIFCPKETKETRDRVAAGYHGIKGT